MATGMLNTANAIKQQAPQLQQQDAVLRSGEKTAMLVTGGNAAKVKTFYHQIPGARFIMPDGLELTFMGGQFSTDDEACINELNKVADRGTSMIYTRKPGSLAEVVAKDAKAATAAIEDTSKLTGV